MKRRFAALCALMMLAVACCWAAAEPQIPSEVRTYFAEHGLGDAAVTETAQLTGHGSSDCLFILVRTAKGSNVLYCFKYQSGKGWQHAFHTQSAVPQGTNKVSIWLADSMPDWANGRTYKGPLLAIAQYDEIGEQVMFFSAYRLASSGKWNLRRIWSYTGYDSMELADGEITYFTALESGQVAGTAYGTYQRDLRYVSLSAIPKTLRAARAKLTEAPVIPVSAELKAQDVQFSGGKKYNVYSAPDTNALRGGNGKAAVSTNGWIQVFGREGDWILVQYSIDSGHYRFGYISAKSLPKKANVPDLHFNAVQATLRTDTQVTDDPLYSGAAFTTEAAGTQVTWLATMGDWAYIQGARYRGFVPVSALDAGQTGIGAGETGHVFFTYNATDGQAYPLFEITKLLYDADHRVYAVTGRYERIVEDAEGEASGVYADNGMAYTYTLAPDFRAEMVESMTGETLDNVPVTDLYRWYIHAYLNDQEPAGGQMTFLSDLPESEREFAQADFWFVTTRIELDENNQIRYMAYTYVPWG